jgi:hypothetical protein
VLLEGVGDVLQEDEAEHHVLVFGRVHRAAEGICCLPEAGLETEVGPRGGGAVSRAVLPGSGFGHGEESVHRFRVVPGGRGFRVLRFGGLPVGWGWSLEDWAIALSLSGTVELLAVLSWGAAVCVVRGDRSKGGSHEEGRRHWW